MIDIIERLRKGVGLDSQLPMFEAEQTMDEAADEIERLRAALKWLSSTVRPGQPDHLRWGDEGPIND